MSIPMMVPNSGAWINGPIDRPPHMAFSSRIRLGQIRKFQSIFSAIEVIS